MLVLSFVTQLGWGYNNLCGSANIAMLVRGYSGGMVTPVAVARRLGVLNQFTTIGQMVAGLALYNIASRYESNATWEWIASQLDGGFPVIALVDYRKFKDNPRGYRYAHFVLVLGYDGTHVTLHDPLRFEGYTCIPLAEFQAAIASPSLYDDGGTPSNPQDDGLNRPFQAIVPLAPLEAKLFGAGINIDPRNPHGRPTLDQLKGYGSVRLPYSIRRVNNVPDIEEAERTYRNYLLDISRTGADIVLVLTHQVGLEGAGFNYEAMSGTEWLRFRTDYINIIREIARRYAGRGFIYQIMNEQDSEDNRASVVVPPLEYGKIYNDAYDALHAIDPTCLVLAGSYNSGAQRGWQQFSSAAIRNCDGIGIHMYGASAGGLYAQPPIPSVNEQLAYWRRMTTLPLWPTEFGFRRVGEQPQEKMAQFASAFIDACEAVPDVEAPMWYAFSSHMDESYGVLDTNGTERSKLREALTQPYNSANAPQGYSVGRYRVETGLTYVNGRTEPRTTASATAQIKNGDTLTVESVEVSAFSTGYYWQKFRWHEESVWVALTPHFKLVPVSPSEPSEPIERLNVLLATIVASAQEAQVLLDALT